MSAPQLRRGYRVIRRRHPLEAPAVVRPPAPLSGGLRALWARVLALLRPECSPAQLQVLAARQADRRALDAEYGRHARASGQWLSLPGPLPRGGGRP